MHVCFIRPQFDTLVELLTVEQMLLYQAQLKRSEREPTVSKQRVVDDLLKSLGLTHVRASLIGGPMNRGISGGQVKRVNIGIALVASPAVLFLDEPVRGGPWARGEHRRLQFDPLLNVGKLLLPPLPLPQTSGLDSTTSDSIMALVKSIGIGSKCTVVSTIHSPSAKTFATFDDLFLLVGGRVTYFGPLADNALTTYFAKHGFNYAPPMNQVRPRVHI